MSLKYGWVRLESLPKLANERIGPFDLIFIDADKASTPEYAAVGNQAFARGERDRCG